MTSNTDETDVLPDSENRRQDEVARSASNRTFETTDGGYYAVSCPFDTEQYPDEVTVTYGETTYTFTGFKTVASQSKVRPDVILFERCIVE